MRALAVALALLGAPAAASAAEVYKWSSETRAFSYIKKVCDRSPYRVTEVVTQEIFNRHSGVSHVGTGRGVPRGSSVGSGRVRRSYSKVVTGPDPAPPEDYTVTYTTASPLYDIGAVERTSKTGRTVAPLGLDDPVAFGKLRKGQSITIRINEPARTEQESDETCTIESTGSLTGTVTITRVQ